MREGVKRNGIEGLIGAIGQSNSEAKGNRFHNTFLRIEDVNVLPQPRKTFEDVDLLARDIRNKGLLHPVTVARFSPQAACEYIDVINSLWRTNFNLGDLKPARERENDFYYVLLAGERRFRAHLVLSQEEGVNLVEARLRDEMTPFEAIALQASENTHVRVPPHEEAHFYHDFFKLLKTADPKYTLKEFAESVSRRPEVIREAIKYCELPEEVQVFVEEGSLSYSSALEVARIKGVVADVSDEDLKWWALRAITKRYTLVEFRALVSEYIRNVRLPQGMLDIFSQEQAKELKRQAIKQTVAREMIQAVWANIDYFRRVRTLFISGKLGQSESPFSIASPTRVFRRMVQELEALLPFLESHLPRGESEHYGEIFAQASTVLTEVLSTHPVGQTDEVNMFV